MKKSLTLRTQLSILMALIVLLQSLGFVMALSVSKVFDMLDSEAVRLLESTTENRMQSLNTAIGQLVGSLAEETQAMNAALIDLAEDYDITPDAIYLNDAAYQDAALLAGASLISVLDRNRITGAFLILNGSNASKEDAGEHSAVYIRNGTPQETAASTFTLEIGPTVVARQLQLSSSVRWDLDLQFDEGEADYFSMPIWATTQYKRAEMERFGYWSSPIDILQDNHQVVCYTMPLMDGDGNGYGVFGLELSLSFLNQSYLPDTELPFQDSFYAVTEVVNDTASLSWLVAGGALAQVYLRQGQELMLQHDERNALYSVNLEGLGDMFVSLRTLRVYSDNSPFADQKWTLLTFVPQSVLQETSSGVRGVLMTNILMSTFVAFCMVVVLVIVFTQRITGLSRYVENLSPYEDIRFRRTGMREIDELTTAVQKLNQSVIGALKTTSQILELTLLPIGGFHNKAENKYVILTEYLHKLLHLPPGVRLTQKEWAYRYEELKKSPMDGQDNVYQYLDPETGDQMWLRIVEAKTEEETVGVVLDVTKDIEENRRLSRELDYDGLTHIYNRIAFKREVNKRIQEAPDQIGVMIFADLDNLKYINDTFGHDMGDNLIINASDLFREFEQFDGIVSRISGDEFSIYLHGFSSMEEARKLIKRQFRRNENFSLMTPEGLMPIRFSTGLAWYPQDSDNVTDLLKLSDFAMYEAKHKDKGGLYEFNQESYQESSYLLENREAISRLLDEGLFRFDFQPIVSLRTGEVYAYEMLMRPLLGKFKNATEILAVAAAQSKLTQLEYMVVMKAFEVIEGYKETLGERKMFMNSVPSQTVGEEGHAFLIDQYRHLFPNVVIEITEAENNSPAKLHEKVAFIRANGMKIALDDFGSGYSNEIRILSVEPDIVKIDMEMIQGIHKDRDKRNLVANLLDFCKNKGILVIAEGVEDARDLSVLVKMGVDLVQGYYIARPNHKLTEVSPKIRDEILSLQPN